MTERNAEKPILFSAPMVRALLAGTKTQTRRVYDGPVEYTEWLASETIEDMELGGYSSFDDADGNCFMAKPRIGWGDRLWVRETWRTLWSGHDDTKPRDLSHGTMIAYDADGELSGGALGRTRVSLHMPRWASRITLQVTDVRVQRLQDISDKGAPLNDCIAEGMFSTDFTGTGHDWLERGFSSIEKCRYHDLWNRINGEGSWEANPWVAAYTFTVELANIDQAGAA